MGDCRLNKEINYGFNNKTRKFHGVFKEISIRAQHSQTMLPYAKISHVLYPNIIVIIEEGRGASVRFPQRGPTS